MKKIMIMAALMIIAGSGMAKPVKVDKANTEKRYTKVGEDILQETLIKGTQICIDRKRYVPGLIMHKGNAATKEKARLQALTPAAIVILIAEQQAIIDEMIALQEIAKGE